MFLWENTFDSRLQTVTTALQRVFCFCAALLNIQLRHLCVLFVTLFYVFLESFRQKFVILCETNSRKASHGKVTSCFRVTEVRLQDMADYLMHVTKCQVAMIL